MRLVCGGVCVGFFERVLVMEATVSNSETCFHVEDEDFDDVFIGFCLVCEINYDVLKLLFIIELNMVLQVLRSVFFNCRFFVCGTIHSKTCHTFISAIED